MLLVHCGAFLSASVPLLLTTISWDDIVNCKGRLHGRVSYFSSFTVFNFQLIKFPLRTRYFSCVIVACQCHGVSGVNKVWNTDWN